MPRGFQSTYKLVAVAGFSLYALPGFAQQIPQTSVPGAIIQSIQASPNPPGIKPQPNNLDNPIDQLVTPPAPLPENPELQTRFLVNTITLEGANHLDPQKVKVVLSSYEGRWLNFNDLLTVCEALTRLYTEHAYVTSSVILPPQKIREGKVVLKAIEGIVGEIKVKRSRYFNAKNIRTHINLHSGEILRLPPLSQSIRQLEQNPDLNVHATLKPGQHPEQTDVILDVQDRFPLHLAPFYDNLGRSFIGTQRLGLTVTNNNLTGLSDTTSTALSWTRRSFGVANQYTVPVGAHGTHFTFDYAHSQLRIGGSLLPLNVTGKATIYSPGLTQQLVNTERVQLSTGLNLDFKNLGVDIKGSPFNRDRVRELRPSVDMTIADRWGKTYLHQELGIGLGLLGATEGHENDVSRSGVGSKFLRSTSSLTRLQQLPWNTTGLFRITGQSSPDRLVSSDQYQLGGAYTIRGYTEGRVIGDNGYSASGEWRVPCFLFPKSWKLPYTHYALRENIQMVGFVDYGAVFNNHPIAPMRRSQYLLGMGIGLRARLTRFLVARVDVGIPLIRQAPDQQTPRLHFGLQSELF